MVSQYIVLVLKESTAQGVNTVHFCAADIANNKSAGANGFYPESVFGIVIINYIVCMYISAVFALPKDMIDS